MDDLRHLFRMMHEMGIHVPSMQMYCLLDDHTTIPIDTMTPEGQAVLAEMEFGAEAKRQVAIDQPLPGITVSTVFLVLDHQHHEDGPPLLFETMVFGGSLDGTQRRYSTWDEAREGHLEVVNAVLDAVINDTSYREPQ